jgi:hypothetical protein
VADALRVPVGLTHKQANQYLLSSLLRRKAEMFEVPVHFYSLSPAQVRRTTFADGVSAVGRIVSRRFTPAAAVDVPAALHEPADSAPPVA